MGLLFSASIRIAFPSFPLVVLLRDHHQPRLTLHDNGRLYMNVCVTTTTTTTDDRSETEQPRQRLRPRMCTLRAEPISATTTVTNALIATKAPDAVEALRSILPRLDKNPHIIILCNGALAVKEQIQQLFHNERMDDPYTVTLASTTHGAYRQDSNDDDDDDDGLYHVTHAGVGQTFVEEHPSLAQLWDQSGLVASSISPHEMQRLLWQKLAANCTINPMTAILNCNNGQLIHQPLFQQMTPRVLDEIALVFAQQQQQSNYDETTQQPLTTQELDTFCRQVIHDTQDNISSMRQDVLQQRPTEIDYLNGYVVKKGQELGIDTPANLELTELVRQL